MDHSLSLSGLNGKQQVGGVVLHFNFIGSSISNTNTNGTPAIASILSPVALDVVEGVHHQMPIASRR